MAKYGRGLITMPMMEEDFERLQLPMMVKNNHSKYETGFGISFSAKEGVTTGISAFDRARSVQMAVNPNSRPDDIVTPGHMFPLKARQGGVLVRRGHTEGSTDLVRLAGLRPAAVLCEVMNDDGSMAHQEDLEQFARTHQLPILSIEDIVTYRFMTESFIEAVASSPLTLQSYPHFHIQVYENALDGCQHVALISKMHDVNQPCLVRLHSECMTGDVFGSNRCDCGPQLHQSIDRIGKEGGVLLYLRQEGRGIGLVNKIKAYALQQKYSLDTVEANEHLGFKPDEREYGIAAQILKSLNIKHVRLLTNNPKKMEALRRFGIEVVKREALEITPNLHTRHYLKTKAEKLGHLLTQVEKV